jgi:hypothetical protein
MKSALARAGPSQPPSRPALRDITALVKNQWQAPTEVKPRPQIARKPVKSEPAGLSRDQIRLISQFQEIHQSVCHSGLDDIRLSAEFREIQDVFRAREFSPMTQEELEELQFRRAEKAKAETRETGEAGRRNRCHPVRDARTA